VAELYSACALYSYIARRDSGFKGNIKVLSTIFLWGRITENKHPILLPFLQVPLCGSTKVVVCTGGFAATDFMEKLC
jgi:hypothetical protein